MYEHVAMFYKRKKHRKTKSGLRSFPTKLGPCHKIEAVYIDLCDGIPKRTTIRINKSDLERFNPPDQSAGVNYREVAVNLLKEFCEPTILLNFSTFTPKTIADCTEFVKQYYEQEDTTSS